MKGSITHLLVIGMVVGMAAGATFGETPVKGETVVYQVHDTLMKGYLAFDESFSGKRPGVLVVHEWWGLNDYVRRRARMLAELGYVALALDMYGEGKQAMHPTEAGKFSSELMQNFDAIRERFLAGMDFLKQQALVDPQRVAAIGYCFGGGVVLNMARQGVDLLGVASFHGSLRAIRAVQPSGVKAKIIVLHGGDDKFIPPEQVEAFKQEMKAAGADFQFISYPGALHGFTNPEADANAKKFNMAIAYDPDADKKSWDELKEFLKMIFKNLP